MKIADVKLKWKKSPSADVARVQVIVLNDGTETTTDAGPEVEEVLVAVEANKSCSFRVLTIDREGYVATSATYSFTLGDLEAPVPASELTHEILAVRDVEG